ncbi:hypothetical protein C7M84_001508 [Penaeus vannamei]|uniref:RNA-directed DNA polymerase n=1 Tax=Penaeus vannamei TaxID=6689 RepID=A0A423TTG9_PENVA|nr:hypothetical protein C7M84_001508 [Penaeus vannamei]
MSSLPMEPIVKFTGYNYPPEQLFLETENFIASLDPHIQRGSYEFDKRCLQHVTQRLDLTNPAVSAMLSGLTKDADRGWHTFKEQLSQRFMPPRGKASVELARIFKMRPASFSQALYQRTNNVHETRVPWAPPHAPSQGLRFRDQLRYSHSGSRCSHWQRVLLLYPPHGVTCRLHPVRHAGSPVPLTGVTAGRSTGDLHGPPAGPLHGPLMAAPHAPPHALPPAPPPRQRYDSRDPPDSWTPSKNACFRCLREGHRTRDCRFLMYCPFHRSQGHSWEDCHSFPDHVRRAKRALGLAHESTSRRFLDTRPAPSAVSIIPVSSLSKCNTPSACTPTPYIVHGASGSCLDVVGEVSLTIHLSDVPIPHPFVVINGPAVPGDILLGYDFMAKTGLHQILARTDKVTTGPPDTSATTATLSGYTQPKVTPTPGYRNFTPLAATSARTWTPASDSPFCQTSETTVLPPFTDCVVPVTIPDTSGTVLVLPEGIRVHGLLALPAVYDAPDGQFSLRLINTLDSPIRLEHSTRCSTARAKHLTLERTHDPGAKERRITPPRHRLRKLNALTIPDRFPIPSLRSLLQDVGKGHAVFSTLDLQSGFFQVQMDKDSRPLTAFSTPQGHFQFKSMPFGLRNSPITFSRLMSIIMAGLIGNTVFLYLDDLLVVSKNTQEHESKLRKIFQRLTDAGLTINPKEMHILPEENQLPRSHSDSNGISPNSAKIEDILRFPTPREVKHVKSFLGLAGFYRPFIKGFAKIADPLSRLLTKDASFAWTAEHQQSFDTLKSLLTRSPVLIFPDFQLPFTLATDASCTGLGAALMQRIDGRLRPIAYASRKLNAAETRYSVTDLEALAVVADSLSRVPTLHLDVLDREDVKSRQRQDPTYGELIGILESDPSAALPRRPHVPTSELYLEGDLLFRRSSPPKQRGTRQRHTYKQLVIPEDLVPTILRLLHEAPTASHAGADKAIKFARERYFFPRMASRITEHIRRCQVCPLHKGSASAPAPALTYDVPDRPFQRVSVDILSGFSTSTSGCRYLLVFIDAFSRFCELVPIPDKSAPTVARAFLERVICRHNTPEEFVSDNGTEFNNSVLKSLCDILNIKKVNVLPYRPQANGLTERLNRTILSMLRTSLASSGSEWDLWIPIIQMAINNTFHSTLGDTPHFVVYGEDRDYHTNYWTRVPDRRTPTIMPAESLGRSRRFTALRRGTYSSRETG